MSGSFLHIAQGTGALSNICDEVCRLKPGQCVVISRDVMAQVNGFYHNDTFFAPEDRVLENIIGAAYMFSHKKNPITGDVTFCRYENTGSLYYKSPDDGVRLREMKERRRYREQMRRELKND